MPASRSASLTSGSPRALRALAVALSTVLMALGCHTVAGGAMPPAWVAASLLGAAVPLCWALSSRRWSAPQLVGIFLLAQTAVHLLSMTTATAGADMHMGGPLGMSRAMIISHAVGGVLLVLLVLRGEHLLWAVVEALALRVVALMHVLTPVGATSRPTPCTPVLGPLSRPWRDVAVDRGPPLGHASLQLA